MPGQDPAVPPSISSPTRSTAAGAGRPPTQPDPLPNPACKRGLGEEVGFPRHEQAVQAMARPALLQEEGRSSPLRMQPEVSALYATLAASHPTRNTGL